MKVRVTPISEDGVWGDPINHDHVTVYDPQVDPDSGTFAETLLLEDDGVEFRYQLDRHWVEILPEADAAPDPDGDEAPDDLGRAPEEVRAEFDERQAAVTKLRRQIRDHHGDDATAKAEFEKWSEGVDYETADLVLIGNYWAQLKVHP